MKGPLKSPLRIQQGGANFLAMENVNYIWSNYFKPNVTEQIRLLPDSIFYGSLMLALVTQSYSMSIFAVALLESGLIGAGLRKLITYMDLMRTIPEISKDPSLCDSSFYSPTLETLLSFGTSSIQSSFPSFPVFFLSTACAYVVTSLFMQKDELEALGSDYAARYYMGVFASFLLLLTITGYRMAYGCDGIGVILLTLFIGFLVGGLLTFQMNQLLGRDAINLTGVPLLRERTRDGKPLYVCPQRTNE